MDNKLVKFALSLLETGKTKFGWSQLPPLEKGLKKRLQFMRLFHLENDEGRRFLPTAMIFIALTHEFKLEGKHSMYQRYDHPHQRFCIAFKDAGEVELGSFSMRVSLDGPHSLMFLNPLQLANSDITNGFVKFVESWVNITKKEMMLYKMMQFYATDFTLEIPNAEVQDIKLERLPMIRRFCSEDEKTYFLSVELFPGEEKTQFRFKKNQITE